MSTPEALRVADAIDRDGLMVASSVIFDDAPAELRRQHAEIERLTAELAQAKAAAETAHRAMQMREESRAIYWATQHLEGAQPEEPSNG